MNTEYKNTVLSMKTINSTLVYSNYTSIGFTITVAILIKYF